MPRDIMGELERQRAERDRLKERFDMLASREAELDGLIKAREREPRPGDERDAEADRMRRDERERLLFEMNDLSGRIAQLDREINDLEAQRSLHVEDLQSRYENLASRHLELDNLITEREREPRPGDERDADQDRQRREERDQLSRQMHDLQEQFSQWQAQLGPEGTADRMRTAREEAGRAGDGPPPPTPPPSDVPSQPGPNAEEEAAQEAAGRGCLQQLGVPAIAITAVLALAIGAIVLLLNRGDGSTKITTASSGGEQPAGPFDGHWVLTSPMQDPNKDMILQCGGCWSQSGWTVTFDKSEATLDISNGNIVGGTFKVGVKATTGDPCAILEQHFEGTPTGGVDPSNLFVQVRLDGKADVVTSCDANRQPVHDPNPLTHLVRYVISKGNDTLWLCYALTPTYDGCADPSNNAPVDQPAATLQRG